MSQSGSRPSISVLFEDPQFVAVHKPPGMLVHRSKFATDNHTLIQAMRIQLGYKVFPLHRLDRGTAGIVLFAKDSESASALGKAIMEHRVDKKYLAIVRGWIPTEGVIDHPLDNELTGKSQDAVTHYRCLAQAELPIPVDRYATSRYSLAEITLQTGRLHQIRKHFRHFRHPINGDRKHGDRHHCNMWRDKLNITGMMLLAWKIKFLHPTTGLETEVQTTPQGHFQHALEILNWQGLEHFQIPQTDSPNTHPTP
jgi:tRNA pseudouridine65 synthase